MSVVIATRMPDGRVLVAAESRASAGQHYNKLSGGTSKLFQREDGLIMGSVGRCSDNQALRYDENFIPKKDLRDLDTGYMVNLHTYIVNKLMDYHGFIGPTDEILRYSSRADDVFGETTFLIAYNDGAWTLDPDGCVMELDDNDPHSFLCIGSGSPYCEAYLFDHLKEAKTPDDTKRIVKEAILNACKSTATIDSNVIMFTTEPVYNIPLGVDVANALADALEESAAADEGEAGTSKGKVDAEKKEVKSTKARRPRRKKN